MHRYMHDKVARMPQVKNIELLDVTFQSDSRLDM